MSLFINVFASSVKLADLFAGLAEPAQAQSGPALGFVFGQQPLDDVFDLRQQLAVAGEVGYFHVGFGVILALAEELARVAQTEVAFLSVFVAGCHEASQKLAVLLGFVV